MPTLRSGAACALLALIFGIGCETGLSSSPVPIAVVSADAEVLFGLGAELDGGDSYLPGQPDAELTYAWRFVVWPGGSPSPTGEIAEPSASLTALSFSEPGLYVIRLDVFDQGRAGRPAFVNVRVARGSLVARAEADPPDPEIGQTVRLISQVDAFGIGLDDVSYTWTQLGPGEHPVVLSSPNDAETTFVAPSTPTRLVFGLEVTAFDLVSETVVEVDVQAGDVDLDESTFDVDPKETVADGASTLLVSAILRDASGNRLLGRNVTFSATAGTLLGEPAEDSEGEHTQLLRAPVEAGQALVRLLVGGVELGLPIAVDFVPGPPDRLLFEGQPTEVRAGDPITPPVTVRVVDAHGNTPVESVAVTLNLQQGEGTLGGTRTQSTEAGLSTFGDLWLDTTGDGFRLRASSPGVSSATSDTFAVTPGPDRRFVFTAQPENAIADAPIPGSPTVEVHDSNGNLVEDFDGLVTMAAAGPGPLSGETQVMATGGVAVFTGLVARQAGSYELNASATDVMTASSESFTVVHGAAQALVFASEPTSTVSMTTFAPAVQVEVLDAYGNRVIDGAPNVEVDLIGGDSSASLGGLVNRTPVDGLATFDDLTVDLTASGYQLVATSTGLEPATSLAFDVGPGAADHLIFGSQPGDIRAGDLLDRITVIVRDAQGNVATGHDGGVSLELQSVSATDAQLIGTTSLSFEEGQAHFDGLTVHRAGYEFTLVATWSGPSSPPSDAFDVAPGAPAYLSFASDPYTLDEAVCSLPVTVRVYDLYENETWFDEAAQLDLDVLDDRVSFYATGQCEDAVSSVPFPAGISDAVFYFMGETPGDATLTATIVGVSGTSQTHTILALPPLVVTVDPEAVSGLMWDTVPLSAEVSGGLGPYTWRWEIDAEPLAGAGAFAATPEAFDDRGPEALVSDPLFFPSRSGAYTLRATAEDDRGETESAVVTISVSSGARIGYPTGWGINARRQNRHLAVNPINGHVGIATGSRGAVYRPAQATWHYLDCLPGTFSGRPGWTLISGEMDSGARRFFWSSLEDRRLIRIDTYVSSCDETRVSVHDSLPENPDLISSHAQGPDGRIWISTSDDITTVDPDAMTASGHYWFQASGENTAYSALGFSPGGRLVAAPNAGGYYLVDPDQVGASDPAPLEALPEVSDRILAVTPGLQANGVDEVWLSTEEGGLWRLGNASGDDVPVRYDPATAFDADVSWWRGVFDPASQDVWFVVGSEGLARYKRDVDRVVGMPVWTNGICQDGDAYGGLWSVAVDDHPTRGHTLWLGCDDGLFRVIP